MLTQLLFCTIALVVMNNLGTTLSYTSGILIIAVATIHSYIQLDRRLGLKLIFEKYKKNLKHKNG